jgi:hypothetical protein
MVSHEEWPLCCRLRSGSLVLSWEIESLLGNRISEDHIATGSSQLCRLVELVFLLDLHSTLGSGKLHG